MSAVIYEVDPAKKGWVKIDGRTWRRPDGSLYMFPPDRPEKLVIFEKLPANTIRKIP